MNIAVFNLASHKQKHGRLQAEFTMFLSTKIIFIGNSLEKRKVSREGASARLVLEPMLTG